MTPREEYRAKWIAAIETASGSNRAWRQEWTDLPSMVSVLRLFMGEQMGHMYFPTGGGMGMQDVRQGSEIGTIEFLHETTGYVLKPTILSVNYIEQSPEESFVYVQGGLLRPTGTYPYPISDSEEIVELSPGQYAQRAVWDEGNIGYDEYGDEIPLPGQARLVIRFLRGNFMVVGNGSMWNGTAGTYDGQHDKLGERGVRNTIEHALANRA